MDCFDIEIVKMLNANDHQKLTHDVDLIREQMEDLQRQLDALVDDLRQAEDYG